MQKKSELISVIMSVYNNEKYVEKTIQSVLSQTYCNFEFLITDDNSNDITREILTKFQKKDSRIKLIFNEKNIGLTQSLNQMLKMSKGTYIARIDGDDICSEKRFELQMKSIAKTDADIVFSDSNLIDENGNFICKSWRPNSVKKILQILEIHNYIPHPTVLIKKEIFDMYGFYNENYRTGQDKELWIRLKNKGVKFYYLDLPLISYRINPNSVRKTEIKSHSYQVANTLIMNRQKKKALKFISESHIKEKYKLVLKILAPYYLLWIKEWGMSLREGAV